MEIKDGEIYIGGVSVDEIANSFGTPTYVYDEAQIRANYRKVRTTFEKYYPDFKMFYAVKC